MQIFGGVLTTLLITAVVCDVKDTLHAIHLISSAVCDYTVTQYMEGCSTMRNPLILFWCFDMRENRKLNAQLFASSRCFGARGPLTRKALDLPHDTPLGDPALLTPILHQPRRLPDFVGKAICIPHVVDEASERE